MSVDATDAPAAAQAADHHHREDVRTPPLSPSASAASASANDAASRSQFWCHECDANVATRVDEATDEVCCQRCGGNFVEEVEAVRANTTVAPLYNHSRAFLTLSRSRVRSVTRLFIYLLVQDDPPEVFRGDVAEPAAAGTTAASAPPSGSTAAHTYVDEEANEEREVWVDAFIHPCISLYIACMLCVEINHIRHDETSVYVFYDQVANMFSIYL